MVTKGTHTFQMNTVAKISTSVLLVDITVQITAHVKTRLAASNVSAILVTTSIPPLRVAS
ncbi:hypothetical protein YC2023_058429 [Brassica napus]